jgi:hypothetical protein
MQQVAALLLNKHTRAALFPFEVAFFRPFGDKRLVVVVLHDGESELGAERALFYSFTRTRFAVGEIRALQAGFWLRSGCSRRAYHSKTNNKLYLVHANPIKDPKYLHK